MTPPVAHAETTVPDHGPVATSRPLRSLIRPRTTAQLPGPVLPVVLVAGDSVRAGVPGPPITGVGPFLAAVIVLGVTQGRAGITRLLRSMIQWRVPARAYLAGICLPLLVSGSAILLSLAARRNPPRRSPTSHCGSNIPIVMLLLLLIPGIGGAWEEPGWRGFALGRLRARFGALAGPLVLGVFWVFWHLPALRDRRHPVDRRH